MNISAASFQKLNNTVLLLKGTFAFLLIAAGADKFFNLLVMWQQYAHPFLYQSTGLQYETFIAVVGVVEIGLGILLLTPWARAAAYGIAFWFLAIIVNLVVDLSYLDIAARDFALAVGAITLARLIEIQEAR